MTNFRKQEDCPTSQELLAFQVGDLELAECRPIRKHLSTCDFCTAEVEFYERYPPEEAGETNERPEMPAPLQELAEALIGKEKRRSDLERLLSDIDAG